MAEGHAKNHDYHLVEPSPWPIIGSVGAFLFAVGGIVWMRSGADKETVVLGLDLAGPWLFMLALVIVAYTMIGWWRDTVRESRGGYHTPVVQLHLRYGMILFIASEVFFFVAWFWAYFDVSLFPSDPQLESRFAVLGGEWPPVGIETFDPWHLPLFNTMVLLLSGTTVTWAHHALLEGDRKGLIWGLVFTVGLGMLFTGVQAYEYAHATFPFGTGCVEGECIYGSTFFMATGFHGFHVIVGTIFLAVCLLRAARGHFTREKHFGLEAAAWYWHFVDVVWLFLFAAIYWWGGN
jgi:cytochrome c oxidase subunit 3